MAIDNKTSVERLELVKRVREYLSLHEGGGPKVNTTIRGYLEVETEQIRFLLDVLCTYESADEDRMKLRDELLHIFFKSK